MKDFKITLAAARVNAGMTQEDVAKALQVSNKTVGNWENGTTMPNTATVFMLADLYKVPKEFIFLPEKST